MEILKVSSKNFKEIVEISVKLIKEGKVIIFPTDTVYGLLADATNKKVIKKVFEIKKREFRKPLPVFVESVQGAKQIAEFGKKEEKILKKIWPGKVTAILKAKNKKLPQGIIYKNKIGIRIPNYKFLNNLLKKIKIPLAQTSANISGRPTPTKISGILRQFKNKKHQPDLVVDAGRLDKKPSVILDLTQDPPKILRY